MYVIRLFMFLSGMNLKTYAKVSFQFLKTK